MSFEMKYRNYRNLWIGILIALSIHIVVLIYTGQNIMLAIHIIFFAISVAFAIDAEKKLSKERWCGDDHETIGQQEQEIAELQQMIRSLRTELNMQIVEYESRGKYLYRGLGAPVSVRVAYNRLGKERPRDLPPLPETREQARIEELEAEIERLKEWIVSNGAKNLK